MISLSSLPVEVLEEVFHHFNQHYTLTLAPLHSRFYCIAKPKLYRNIYVYPPWSLCDKSKEPKDWNETFHISKNLNNRKSERYTIISSHTLDRYLAKMDRTQEIYHLGLYAHNVTMIDCVLRHFATIRYFELVALYRWEICKKYVLSLQSYLDLYYRGMIFNTPLYELGPSSSPHENVKSIKISDAYCRNNPEYPSWLQNVSELTIYVYDSEEYKQCRFRMRLQVLEVLQSYFKNKSGINFPLSDVFETRYLRELTIDGDINIGAIFTCEDLENVFPKLVQLCLRVYGKNYAPSALRYLKRFTHGKLKSLIISSENTSECDARDVCELCTRYPNSCINWWGPQWSSLRSRFTHKLIVLSPSLPLGVIGYHVYDTSDGDITNFTHAVTSDTSKEVLEVKFQRWYTRAQLFKIYHNYII